MSIQTGKHILIVDDASDILALLADFFEGEGYSVSLAQNGLEALNFLKAATILPDLILLDLMMPEIDGYQFRAEQQKNPKFSSIPVVIMTADGHIQTKSSSIQAQGFLKKPFKDPDTILQAVQVHLK